MPQTARARCPRRANPGPSGDVPQVGEDGPSPRARQLDVDALVAAAVERAVAPLLDENRRLRARIDELEAAPRATAMGVPSRPRPQVMGWTELAKAAHQRGVRNDAGWTLTPAVVRSGGQRPVLRFAAPQRHGLGGGVAREAERLSELEIAPLGSTTLCPKFCRVRHRRLGLGVLRTGRDRHRSATNVNRWRRRHAPVKRADWARGMPA